MTGRLAGWLTWMCLCALGPLGGVAQLMPASPPLADPADARFRGVTEDWNSPSLSSSSLRPATPLVSSTEYAGYTVDLIRLQWRWADPVDLYVMKPKGVQNPPVILYLYGYPADTDRFQNETFQKTVIKDGFAAVGFVSALTGHRYHDRPMKEWFLSELQESLATSAHDVQMILNYLASRGDLDTTRLGMYAQGSGASIAILASAADARIKVLDTLDPWGDWPVWMAQSPFVPEEERAQMVSPEFLKRVAILEPIEWLPKVRARKFRLQDAVFEKNTPLEAKTKLRAAVPPATVVTLYKTPADFNVMIRGNRELDWIKTQIRSLPAPREIDSEAKPK
jgi:hypothetical protein